MFYEIFNRYLVIGKTLAVAFLAFLIFMKFALEVAATLKQRVKRMFHHVFPGAKTDRFLKL